MWFSFTGSIPACVTDKGIFKVHGDFSYPARGYMVLIEKYFNGCLVGETEQINKIGMNFNVFDSRMALFKCFFTGLPVYVEKPVAVKGFPEFGKRGYAQATTTFKENHLIHEIGHVLDYMGGQEHGSFPPA